MKNNIKARLIISCFYDSLNPSTLPVGFSWVETLTKLYRKTYRITLLLHGKCIKFGLDSSAYKLKYRTENPYAEFLHMLLQNTKLKLLFVIFVCIMMDLIIANC